MQLQTSALLALLGSVLRVVHGESERWNSVPKVRRLNLRHSGASGKGGKTELVQTVSSEESNAKLRQDLVDSAKQRRQLRWRLDKVSHEARARLSEFEREVQDAKVAATRSNQRLRNEIMQEKTKLYRSQQSLTKLRRELAIARKAESHERAMVAALKKAEAKVMTKRKVEQNLEASVQSMRLMKVELATAQQATAREHSQLLQSQRAVKKASAELESEKAAEKQLRVDMERYSAAQAKAAARNATAAAEAKAAQELHREHLGLLVQINELQEQSQKLAQQEQAAESNARAAKKEAQERIAAQVNASKVQDLERQKHIAALLQQTQVARANLSAAAEEMRRVQSQVTALKATVAQKEEQLRVTFLSLTDLRTARDAASKGEATYQKMDKAAEASLKASREELTASQSQLQEVRSQVTASEKQVEALRAQSKEYEAKLRDLKRSSDAEKAQEEYQLHETMITAASKVHDLEDQNENLTSELHKAQEEMSSLQADSAKAKDTLLQETESALKATQRADALSADLNDAEKESEASRKHVSELSQKVSSLEEAQESAQEAAKAHQQDSARWQAKAEKLEASEQAEATKVTELSAANANLTSQVARLSDAEQRANDLEQALGNTRVDLQKKSDEKAELQKKVDNLRALRDHYSAEFDTSRNESDTWRLRAQDLGGELTQTQKQMEGLTRQRDKALQRFKEARSQEDEYFDENTRLEQQNEALTTKLNDVSAAANQSIASASLLQSKVDDLQSQQARERQNSHLAWERTEKELLQAHKDLQMAEGLAFNLKAELSRTQAVLTNKERKMLGLPVADAKAKSQAGPKPVTAAPETPEASASSEFTSSVPLDFHAQQPGQPEEPLPPQMSHGTVSKSGPRKALKTDSPTAASASVVSAPAVAAASTTHAQALLPGEPPHVVDDAAATLASVTETKGTGDTTSPAPRSALQRLAEYFASPLPR